MEPSIPSARRMARGKWIASLSLPLPPSSDVTVTPPYPIVWSIFYPPPPPQVFWFPCAKFVSWIHLALTLCIRQHLSLHPHILGKATATESVVQTHLGYQHDNEPAATTAQPHASHRSSIDSLTVAEETQNGGNGEVSHRGCCNRGVSELGCRFQFKRLDYFKDSKKRDWTVYEFMQNLAAATRGQDQDIIQRSLVTSGPRWWKYLFPRVILVWCKCIPATSTWHDV